MHSLKVPPPFRRISLEGDGDGGEVCLARQERKARRDGLPGERESSSALPRRQPGASPRLLLAPPRPSQPFSAQASLRRYRAAILPPSP